MAVAVITDDQLEAKIVKSGGMGTRTLEKFLSDIAFQPKWRIEADRAADYYDGNQMEPAIIAALKDRGQPILIHNLIAPAIDGVLGLEAKTRTDWKLLADDDSGIEVVDGLNQELNEAARISMADRACADAYAAQVKTGLGWVEINQNPDPFSYKWRVNYVHRREIFWDWHAQRPDLEDARWLIRRKWLDVDTLKKAFPGHEDLIDQVKNGWAHADNWGEDEVLRQSEELWNAYQQFSQSEMGLDEWWDSDRELAQVYEVYYRTWESKPVLKTQTGEVFVFDMKNPVHQAVIMQGMGIVEYANFPKMRLSYFIGPHRVADMDSPHPHNKFPYVPFWGFREDRTSIPYGLIRRMMPAQDEINKRRSKLTWILNKITVLKDDDAVENMSNDDLIDELLMGDSVIDMNSTRKNPKGLDIQWGNEIASQQFQVMQDAQQLIQETAGIYSAFLGQDSSATSGVAIDSLVEQGTTTMGELNDNYRFARRLVGELLLANIVDDIGDREHAVQVNVNKADKTKVVQLNQRVADEHGRKTITNSITRTKTQVVLSDITNTPGYRQQVAKGLLEIVGQVPPQFQAHILPMVIEMLDIPEDKRQELLKNIRTASGQVDPETLSDQEREALEKKQQLQDAIEKLGFEKMQLELQKLSGDVRNLNAKTDRETAEVKNTMAETKEKLARVKKIMADTVAVRAQLHDAMQAEAKYQQSASMAA